MIYTGINVFDITQNRSYIVILCVIMYILRIVYLHCEINIVD